MKVIRITKFLGTIYQYYEISTGVPMRDHIFTLNNILIGPGKKIKVTFDTRGSGAYTSLERGDPSTRRVVLGGGLVKQIAGLPDTITEKAVMKTLFSPSIKAIMALNLHEMGHNLFTDMVSKDIVEYKDPSKRGLLHSLFNIIEDYVVEENMVLYYKKNRPYDVSPRRFFDFTINSIFVPQAEKYNIHRITRRKKSMKVIRITKFLGTIYQYYEIWKNLQQKKRNPDRSPQKVEYLVAKVV